MTMTMGPAKSDPTNKEKNIPVKYQEPYPNSWRS